MSGAVLGFLDLSWGTGTNFGVPRSVLGCLDLFGAPRILECQDPSVAAGINLGVPGSLSGPVLGCRDPSQGANTCFGLPGSLPGARTHLGVPRSVSGCQNPSVGAWVCFGVPGLPPGMSVTLPRSVFGYFGVPGPILGCQYLLGHMRVPPRASEPFQGCQDLFCMPGSVPGWQDPFWGATVPSGIPGPILSSRVCLGLAGSLRGFQAHLRLPGSVLGFPDPFRGARTNSRT